MLTICKTTDSFPVPETGRAKYLETYFATLQLQLGKLFVADEGDHIKFMNVNNTIRGVLFMNGDQELAIEIPNEKVLENAAKFMGGGM